jgi:hypothetical protein
MKYSWIVRLVGVLVLVIGIAAVAYFAYTAGAASAAGTAGETVAVGHTPWGGWHPLQAMAFFPFALCLIPFFLCLFILLPLRMIFGPHRHPMHMQGKWHAFRCGEEVPHPVEEWHRRMHETKPADE